MIRFVLATAGLLAVLLPLSSVPARAADMSAEAKALAKLDDDWSAAAATRDAKRVASFYADDAIAYPPNEPAAVGKAAAEKVWAAYFADPSYNLSWKTTHAEVNGATRLHRPARTQDSFKGPDGKNGSREGKVPVRLEEAERWEVESDTRHVEHGFEAAAGPR